MGYKRFILIKDAPIKIFWTETDIWALTIDSSFPLKPLYQIKEKIKCVNSCLIVLNHTEKEEVPRPCQYMHQILHTNGPLRL